MAYLARRIALGVLTLWLISLATFMLLRIAPGDAVTAAIARSPGEGGLAAADIAKLRQELGLDRFCERGKCSELFPYGAVSVGPG